MFEETFNGSAGNSPMVLSEHVYSRPSTMRLMNTLLPPQDLKAFNPSVDELSRYKVDLCFTSEGAPGPKIIPEALLVCSSARY